MSDVSLMSDPVYFMGDVFWLILIFHKYSGEELGFIKHVCVIRTQISIDTNLRDI